MKSFHRRQRVFFVCVLAASCHAALAAEVLSGTPAVPASPDATTTNEVAGNTAAAPESDATKTLSSVVVTGVRKANAAAIESKREATNITDVVSSTDVRALPDTTIVEALRRIPGLSVLPATDNEHPRDEAATPVLRGLGPSYNNVTIDGLTVASPGTPNGTLGSITRGVRLDILPASMVSELQVIKTFTPDLDPNATGGAINLKTRSAFENGGKPFFTAEASLGHANDVGKPRDQDDPGYRLLATGSRTFGSEGQYGLTLSGNYQTLSSYTETHMTTDTVHYGFYDSNGVLQSGTNLGNGWAVPQQDKYWYVMDKRDRYGLTGKFEAHVSESLQAYALAGYYYFRDNMERNEVIIDPRNRNNVYNQTATSGTYPAGDVEVGYSNQITTTRTKLGQTGFEWRPDDRQVLSARGSWSDATYEEPMRMIKYVTGASRPAAVPTGQTGPGVTVVPNAAYGFNYDTSGLNQRFPIAPQAYYNYDNYSLLYWRPDYQRSARDKVLTGRLDYAFNRGEMDRGLGFGTGLSYTRDEPGFNIYRVEYQPNRSAPALNIADVLAPSNAPMRYLNMNLIAIDPAKANKMLNSVPLSAFNSTDQSAFSNQDNFSHSEKIFGTYGLVSYRADAFDVEAGLHYDHTDQSTVGRQRQLDAASGKYVYVDAPTHSHYGNLLPSAIMTYHLSDRLDLRAGASRTLGRPPYDAYAARTSIGFVSSNDMGNPNAQGVTVTIGNPDIKPRISTNLDLSLEWRLPDDYDGMLAAAVFDKRIQDEIFTLSRIDQFTFNGTTYSNVLISTPANASKAHVRGLELSAVLNTLLPGVPALSGLGASANLALLNGGMDVPFNTGTAPNIVQSQRSVDYMVGQPDYTANASLFYTVGGVELRAAYNRQGKALRSIVSNIPWQDLYWAPRSQLDLSATWAVSKQLSVVGQVSNVTHSRLTSFTGPGENLLKDSYSMPTTYWIGLRFTPSL
ncbi:TonB-dependent receptor [Xanthomonas albilineans]|uniref:TonB-dependent receptor n=1 Tax=Xanthomonas albilineans TaxID=29447 RepID=UPI0005F347C8|nr:TonB-dependent receptor [Xanthomonas albilineans]